MILAVFGALPFAVPANAALKYIKSGDWEYILGKENKVKITDYLGNEENVTIPDTIDGHYVNEILSLPKGSSSKNESSIYSLILFSSDCVIKLDFSV